MTWCSWNRGRVKGMKLVLKGKRKGYELDWEALVSGEAALAAALNASLAKGPTVPPAAPLPSARTKKAKASGR